MSSPDSTSLSHALHGAEIRHYPVVRFDKGARMFAFCCAALYAILSGGFVIAIVSATLKL